MINKLIYSISQRKYVPFIVKLVIVTFLSYLFNIVHFYRMRSVEPKKVKHKFCVITGGTRGIGRELVDLLVLKGYEVMVLGRTKVNRSKVVHYGLDLNNLQEVAQFKMDKDIDLLVMNAGILTGKTDGIDLNFKINYLAHYILYNNLRSNLKNARVVLTSSCVMLSVDTFDPYRPSFFSFRKYCESKLCVFLLGKYISRNLQTVVVHPGVVNTTLFNENSLLNFFISKISYPFLNSTDEAANVLMNACQFEMSREKKIIFLYGFEEMKIPCSINRKNEKKLMKITKHFLVKNGIER
ncbi:Dehydrogenase with different specificities [Trachipleistophora hominis]|uniref:Dehydrogenase with different specificities n=1 Tax=Trachipleistophora hominis TaxID=72359 RepID=L7JXW2_TRAHO|nr:Dehydrogenase with different specificities [Trachipleistophora hominis]